MSFNPGGGGGIAAATDVALSNPTNNQALAYDSAVQKWKNSTISGSGAVTAAVSTATGGEVTLTPGTSAQLTKLKSTLVSGLTFTLATGADNSVFELSFIDTVFNGQTITIGSDTFAYPTYVKYVSISSVWERVI